MKKLTDEENKKRLLGILAYIDEVCRTNQITYFMAYGSLLGTIRHQGFIPWDDDIDIWVPIDQLDQFIKAINQSKDYAYTSVKEDANYRNDFGKVIDLNTSIHESYPIVSSTALFVDVFPLYSLGNTQEEMEKNLTLLKKKKLKLWYYNAPLKKVSGNLIKKTLKILYILPKKLYMATHNMQKYMIGYENIEKKLNEQYPDSEYLGYLDNPHNNSITKNMFKKEWFSIERATFENITVNIPSGFKEILERIYGDYMTLPPVEERMSHDYEAYLTHEPLEKE